MREMLAFHASFDATEWTFMDFGYFYDFWPFLGVKNGGFGRKWPFFQIFGFLLLSASASLCSVFKVSTVFDTFIFSFFEVQLILKLQYSIVFLRLE